VTHFSSPCSGVSRWNYHHYRRCLAISTSPESGPESSAPLLPSLDDLPTLREMLGLPDRESSPEEVDDDDDDDDDDSGLKRLFWMPPDMESLRNGLRPSSPAPKPSAPASELVSSASTPEPVSSVPAPEPVSSASVLDLVVFCFRSRSRVLCLRPRACVSYPRPRASIPCPCPYPRVSALQAHTVYPGPLCCFGRA
jgi:hypothetical protein